MNSSSPLWVCDSCTLIDILTDDQRYVESLAPVKQSRTDGNIILGVSEVSVAEVCKITTDKGSKCPTEIVDEYLADAHSRRYPVTASVSARANVLIRLCSLETCDALIVATALLHGATHLITRDESTLCKRIRKAQKLPVTLRQSKATLAPIYTESVDEATVIDELKKLDIFEVLEKKK